MNKYEILYREQKRIDINEVDINTPSCFTLYRIRALKDFANVKAGDLGGWVQFEDSLSQDGNCWIGGESCVFMNAKIKDNAIVTGEVYVCGDACVKDNAKVEGINIMIANNAIVEGDVKLTNNKRHRDYGYKKIPSWRDQYQLSIANNSIITDHAELSGSIKVLGHSIIKNGAVIKGDITIANSVVRNSVTLNGSIIIEDTNIGGNTKMSGDNIHIIKGNLFNAESMNN